MSESPDILAGTAAAMSAWAQSAPASSSWEWAAVALAIAYLWLAIRQSLWCWGAAFASTAIYLVLMFRAQLYMESALQVFYLGMAIYGGYSWRHGPGSDHELPVTTWDRSQHGVAIASVLTLSLISGAALDAFSDAALPYLDSFTTWGALVTTWMVARKVLENWLYWFVIDTVSIFLYVSRELYLTALLFGLYLVMIVFGFITWRRDLQRQAGVAA